jgi:hypothetical protein
VKVLSRVVAPWKVSAPGVVLEPIVFIEEAPDPNVLVVEEPVANVELPEELRVVNRPLLAVPEPMAPGAANVAPFKDSATTAAGTAPRVLRGVISPSHDGLPVPPIFTPRYTV